MPKQGPHPRNALTALAVRKTSTPGRYADGNGLYLEVDPGGAKRWVQRIVAQGRRRDIGLGSVAMTDTNPAPTRSLMTVSMSL
jgi:hypothetical protein